MASPTTSVYVPMHRRAPMTMILLIINIMIFMLASQDGISATTQRDVLVEWGAAWIPGLWMGEYWRFLTPALLHIGLAHLIINSWALMQLGGLLEPWMGSRNFLILYWVGALAGNAFSMGMHGPLSAGASTSLFAVFGALFMVSYHISGSFRAMSRDRLGKSVLFFTAMNAAISLLPGISFMGHFGGFVAGLIIGHTWYVVSVFRRKNIKPQITWCAALGIAMVVLCVMAARPLPDDPVYQFVRGRQLMAESKHEEALKHFETASNQGLDPRQNEYFRDVLFRDRLCSPAGIMLLRARITWKLERTEESLSLYHDALVLSNDEQSSEARKLFVSDVVIRSEYAENLLDLGRKEQALEQYMQRPVKGGRRPTRWLMAAADLATELNDEESLNEVMKIARDDFPHSPEFKLLRAKWYLSKGNDTLALVELSEIAKDEPRFAPPEAYFLLGQLQSTRDKAKASIAFDQYLKASRWEEDNDGQRDEARAFLEKNPAPPPEFDFTFRGELD